MLHQRFFLVNVFCLTSGYESLSLLAQGFSLLAQLFIRLREVFRFALSVKRAWSVWDGLGIWRGGGACMERRGSMLSMMSTAL